MKIKDAFHNWESEIKPLVIAQYGADDEPALSESWNDYTDSLCKDGELSDLQYHYCPAWDDCMPEDDFQFILDLMGVTFSSRRVATRTNADDWDASASHWSVTIKRNGKRMRIFYSMGSAHIGSPQDADIMAAILRDHESASEDFADWCANLGYDTDSRKALRTYKACKRIGTSMARLFTSAELSDLGELFGDY